jgi:hypothetical protein
MNVVLTRVGRCLAYVISIVPCAGRSLGELLSRRSKILEGHGSKQTSARRGTFQLGLPSSEFNKVVFHVQITSKDAIGNYLVMIQYGTILKRLGFLQELGLLHQC